MLLTQAMWRLGQHVSGDAESRLIAAARGGDREALGALYRRHSARAYTLALRLSGDADAAHDVVQDAFLRAFDRLDGYREEAAFGAWLKRIVANVAIERVRSHWRWVREDGELDDETAPAADLAQQHDALGLLAQLTAPARTVLVLYEMEGYTHQEIAALLGRSADWSKTTLSRTRKRMSALLGEEAR